MNAEGAVNWVVYVFVAIVLAIVVIAVIAACYNVIHW